MARTVAGTQLLPNGEPLANATFYLDAKRTEATGIIKGVSANFATNGSGAYSAQIEPGYYAVSVSWSPLEGVPARRWPLGAVWVEDGDPITINALLSANESAADPTDAALLQLLADAQAARDAALAAEAKAEQWADAEYGVEVEPGKNSAKHWAQETENTLASKIDQAEKGVADGLATLDESGKLPAAQLPATALTESEKGVANGVATLDSNVKIPLAQLPDSILGQMEYIGTWNAATNTPAIPAAGADNKGEYYKVSVAGSTNIDGESDWKVGDWIVSNGTTWDKIDNTDSVTSVHGRTGVVTGQAGDYNTDQVTEGDNLYFTEARARNAALDGLSEASSTKPTATDSILSALGKIIAKLWSLVIGDIDGLQTALDGKEPTLPTTANAYFRNDSEGARTAVTPQQVANEINPLLLASVYMTYGGTADAITLTSPGGAHLTALVTGMQFRFRATAANTGAMTIAVDGLTAVAAKTITGADTPADYIRTDVDTVATFDGTNVIVDRQIESGGDANGEYTRFADGTMYCRHSLSSGIGSTASGALYISPAFSWTFPREFSAAPRITALADRILAGGADPVGVSRATSSNVSNAEAENMFVWYSSASASVQSLVSVSATGRWY